jgi:hypothetical protein
LRRSQIRCRPQPSTPRRHSRRGAEMIVNCEGTDRQAHVRSRIIPKRQLPRRSSHPSARAALISSPMPATVRMVRGNILDALALEIQRLKPSSLTLISPWISGADNRTGPLGCILEHARSCGTRVLLVTRPGGSAGQRYAVEAVCALQGGRVVLNGRLHAKLYVCEDRDGRGFAIIGSANLTKGSAGMDELALIVRAKNPLVHRTLIARALASLANRQQTLSPQRRKS